MKQYNTHTQFSGNGSFLKENQLFAWVSRNWFNSILLYLAAHLLFQKEMSLQINMDGTVEKKMALATQTSLETPINSQQAVFVPAINISQLIKKSTPETSIKSTKTEPTFSVSNLTPALGPQKGGGVAEGGKAQAMRAYIEKYAPAAIRAMNKYGIPASITLAQGLLESNAGESKLALESNNHFGIKCRRKCKGCTCRNYTDDDVYDMFRVFDSAWESYEEHSILLTSPRYAHLQKFGKDYKSWAYGLRRAGYATDKTYGQKLIRLIRNLNLEQYDI
ncbi:MAG: glucosaminidase domain-containing protein [Haliscomenobacter sp.]|uniref:glycoside hydrolase family 73 protein n=1 Tax=Haliscomenobacter sp. TaxID=2717303 RepID=UPI0029BC8552|nr:glucosaminidase domain-containing protein [Haliscomenobacter sp.]MDX2067519.1 glucosaminidase domain-containing protein [Haliscomenobacter sp.]